MARHLLPLAITAAALAGLGVATARADARDRDRALLAAETARFGPGTRGRVAAYYAATQPDATLTWRAADPGWLDPTVTVELTVTTAARTERHTFEVTLADRAVAPADAATADLIARIATWAGEK
ncbi:MAG: hypothetical protein H6701_00635 [Myxococcales bacterium]|nr:hypothetical protein [Myxococcales bacterium]